MKTTLNKVRSHSPCISGWKKLLNTLGKTEADDEELSLLTILNSNGVEDAIWCFRAVDGHDAEIRGFARFCAMQHIEKIKPYCSPEQYSLILKWLETGSEEFRAAAQSAARGAEHSAAWSAESGTARSVARSVALTAALGAAWLAAWSAARSAALSGALSVARSAESSSLGEAELDVMVAELRRILSKEIV
jgi:hypothetical protein